MGLLQFGHRLERSQFERAAAQSFRNPALDAIRQVIAASDPERAGWSVEAVSTVREPYRSLAAELLTAQFPARDDEHAVASTRAMARQLVRRAIDAEKQELLGAVQRVPANSDGGRAVRLRLRELDAERQRLLDEE
jgi:DNA primase